MVQPGEAVARYASIVIDAETGTVLHAANADTRNYPASLTKMMTLYMTFEALDQGRLTLHQRLPVSRRAQGITPSKLYLRVGDTIRVEDAVLALVTKSANDAAVVLAEALGEEEWKFARMMTKRARELGMRRTTFRNASGLPNRHQLSTARDMATLSRALIYDYPHYYHYFSTTRFRYQGRTYGSHNNLLDDYRGTDGIKTGYIRASGFNLAASVVRDGRRLIAVVFGGRTARSRDRHIMALLDDGFAQARRLRAIPVVSPPAPKPVEILRVANQANEVKVATAGSESHVVPVPASRGGVADADRAALTAKVARVVDGLPVPGAGKPKAVQLAARQAARADGSYAVQVGAYRAAAPAHVAAVRAGNALPKMLGTSEVSVSRVRGDRGPLYRARLTGLRRSHAERACRALLARGTDCLVIQPRGGVEVAFNAK
nr:D-alanyl-D-alanine carboxypeptidase family protein [Rhodovibrio sodomensis]